MTKRKFLVDWDLFTTAVPMARIVMRVFEGFLYKEDHGNIIICWTEVGKAKGGYIVVRRKGGEETRTALDPDLALKVLARCSDITRRTCYVMSHGIVVSRYENLRDPVVNSDYQPLTIAEKETLKDTSLLERPRWLGAEVTNDHRFSDTYLLNNCKMVTT